MNASLSPAALPTGPVPPCPPGHPQHAVWSLLEAVVDPEIPVVNLREMGILRAVEPDGDGGVTVVITPTYSGCPAMTQMTQDVQRALQQAGVRARVVTRLAPAWSTDWISAPALAKLRDYGIAPPAPVPTDSACPATGGIAQSVVRLVPRHATQVPCPHCGSSHTEQVSPFGSTACKALWRCLDCREPFDHFKPY
ncbi:MAG: phenylacetate-CoA oxygenase subunit PaaJ [Rhodoferax sp.]